MRERQRESSGYLLAVLNVLCCAIFFVITPLYTADELHEDKHCLAVELLPHKPVICLLYWRVLQQLTGLCSPVARLTATCFLPHIA